MIRRGDARRAVFLTLVLSSLAAAARAQSELPGQERYALRVAYRFFVPTLTGDLRKGSAETPGTLLDVQDDLGLEDDRTWDIRAFLQLKPGNKLRGSYTPLDFSGDVTARRTFNYGGTTYDRSERVVSSVKGGLYSGLFELDFVKGPQGFLGGLIGVQYLDLDSVIVAPDQNQREQDSVRAPIPVLGLAARAYLGPLSLEGEISGLTIGQRGSLIQFETSGGFHLSHRLRIEGGYRYLKVRAEDGGDTGELSLSGWQFGLEISL